MSLGDPDNLPQESSAQEIGYRATRALNTSHPDNWRLEQISGDNDYGFDYLVQVVERALVKGAFKLQLKGKTAPTLNVAGTEFSVSLELSTVHYYLRTTEPVMLVLCNLGADPDFRKCPLYYCWIRDQLEDIRRRGVARDQESVTFHIRVQQRLEASTDVLPDLVRFHELYEFGEMMDAVVLKDRPDSTPAERAVLLGNVAQGLKPRSASLLDQLAEEPEGAWVDPPPNTFLWHVRNATTELKAGNRGGVAEALARAAPDLDAAKPLEQADYWNTMGRLKSLNNDEAGAVEAFERACRSAEDLPKYVAAWAEATLRARFLVDSTNDFSDVLARLTATDPKVAATRARILAAAGRFEEAIATVDAVPTIDGLATLAIIRTMRGDFPEVQVVCDRGLADSTLTDNSRQVFLLMRARAKFSMAIAGSFGRDEDWEMPMTGPAGADPTLLHDAWKDLEQVVTMLRRSGWPVNVELIADMWSSIATMLGFQEEALPLVAEAAAAQPNLPNLQFAAESLATQTRKFEPALVANGRQPKLEKNTLRRIALLHEAGKHQDCMDLMASNPCVASEKSPLFGQALSSAIASADHMIRPELADAWIRRLRDIPEQAGMVALCDYFRAARTNPLGRAQALDDLTARFDTLGRPEIVALQLFYQLDGAKVEHAPRVIELAEQLSVARLLDEDGLLQMAQALSALKRWQELLDLSDREITRFKSNDRLRAVGALALDALGRTAEAHARLQALVDRPGADPLALKAFCTIASRAGFVQQAIHALERLIEGESNKKRKAGYLRMLFGLLQETDPNSQRGVDVAWAIGRLSSQDSQEEEAAFLMLMLVATASDQVLLNDERKAEFGRRMDQFTTRFPDAPQFRRGFIPDNAAPDEILRVLQQLSGMTEERLKNRLKLQRELRDGSAPLPYAWRPRHVLDGIPDVGFLWEVSKTSRWDARELHLQMQLDDWKAKSLAELRGHIPILDLISLLVLVDLGLFDLLFKIFPRIAVGKRTLLSLRQMVAPMFGSPMRNKILALEALLQTRFTVIDQPGLDEPEAQERPHLNEAAEEIVSLIKTRPYMVFSDDAIFRVYTNPPLGNPPSICTLDLLLALEESGLMTLDEVAAKIATLCDWRVSMVIPDRHLLAVLPASLATVRSVDKGLAAIYEDPACGAVYNGVWGINKNYEELQANAGRLLSVMLSKAATADLTIAIFACYWLGKVRLHKEAPDQQRMAALLVLQAAFNTPNSDANYLQRLWHIYDELIQFIYGDRMDNDKEQLSIEGLGKIAHEMDARNNLTGEKSLVQRLRGVLTAGTSKADWFEIGNRAYRPAPR